MSGYPISTTEPHPIKRVGGYRVTPFDPRTITECIHERNRIIDLGNKMAKYLSNNRTYVDERRTTHDLRLVQSYRLRRIDQLNRLMKELDQ